MKKIVTAVLLCVFMAMGAAAYELKDSFYVGPYVGYKTFDNNKDCEYENDPEVGLKLGYFLSEHWAAELSGGYVDTKYEDNSKRRNVSTPGIHALYHFRPASDKGLLPFLQGGFEARIADETNMGVALGGGLKYLFNKNVAADVSYKHIFLDEGKHDQLMALSVAFFFGVKDKAPAKAEMPAPRAAVIEEKPAPAPAKEEIIVVQESVTVVVAPIDSDGDGVNDDMDKCPGTPKGYSVDEYGCFKSMKIKINFATDSKVIPAADNKEIVDFANFLKANPDIFVEIHGYTDSTGRDAYNQKLSERRAESVAKALVNNGVPADRIETKGFGKTKPVATNATVEGRAENRRVEVIVINKNGDVIRSQKAQ